MESRVDIVTIEGDVTLDIMALTRYNGQGRCAELRLHDKHKTTSSRNAEERYKKEDWSWAQKIERQYRLVMRLLLNQASFISIIHQHHSSD